MTKSPRLPEPPDVFTMSAETYTCPDCDSATAEPELIRPGVWSLKVSHDDTCPYYRRVNG